MKSFLAMFIPSVEEKRQRATAERRKDAITSPVDINDLIKKKMVVDIRAGGIVKCREEGIEVEDVPVLEIISDPNYYLRALMHGGEFVVNPTASIKHYNRLGVINSHTGSDNIFAIIDNLKATVNVYDTLLAQQEVPVMYNLFKNELNRYKNKDVPIAIVSKFVLYQNQYIINRNATAKFLDELIEINNDVS